MNKNKKNTSKKENPTPKSVNPGDDFIIVTIADRPYKLIVKPEEEEYYRKATKIINERYENYTENLLYKTKDDILALIALYHSVLALQKGCDLTFINPKTNKKKGANDSNSHAMNDNLKETLETFKPKFQNEQQFETLLSFLTTMKRMPIVVSEKEFQLAYSNAERIIIKTYDSNKKFNLISPERIEELRKTSAKTKTVEGLEELERVPAYLRRKIIIESTKHKIESAEHQEEIKKAPASLKRIKYFLSKLQTTARVDDLINQLMKKFLIDPELNDHAKITHLILLIKTSSEYELTMAEFEVIAGFFTNIHPEIKLVWGSGINEDLGRKIEILISVSY